MAANPFRPTVTDLEGRDVPAASGVTPTQVFEAIGFVQQSPFVLTYLTENFEQSRLGGAGQALLSAADLNNGAADTLTKFRSDAEENAAANPAAAGTLLGLANQATTLIAQAQANRAAAEALANRLGTFRPPPPPLPPTGQGNSNNTPQPDQNPPGGTPVANNPNAPGPADPTSPPPSDGSQVPRVMPDLAATTWTAVGTQGLRTQNVVTGTGAEATGSSSVTVRYRGFLAANGTIFDTNIDNADNSRNVPLPATLGPTAADRTVIQGFAQGIVGMRVGGIRNIDIPAELGYGAAGAGESIPPNARLVFSVQLLSVS